MSLAFINPKIIEWAIERRGITVTEVAQKYLKIEDWIAGKKQPTSIQATKLAKYLYVPLGYLYFDKPPEVKLKIEDFRTVGIKETKKPSLNLLATVDNALLKLDWYHEYLIEEECPPVASIDKFTLKSNIKEVAQNIDKVTNYQAAKKDANWKSLVGKFCKNIEESGVMVLRNSRVGFNSHRPLNVEEFRGFAISDKYAPLIFLNTKDAKTAQLFTLAHELAHLWIGKSGISNTPINNSQQKKEIEKFCNAVATELLVPEAEFKKEIANKNITDQLQQLSKIFKVSTRVILKRAFDLEKITFENYQQLDKTEQDNFDKNQKKSKGGGDFYQNFSNVNSGIFTEAVLRSVAIGNTSFTDAAHMMFTHWTTLSEVAKKMEIF